MLFAGSALVGGQTSLAADGGPMTVGQVARQVVANRARYLSLEIEARVTAFLGNDVMLLENATVSSDTTIIYRRTPQRKFVSEDGIEFDGAIGSDVLHARERRATPLAPRWSKRLIEFPDDPVDGDRPPARAH